MKYTAKSKDLEHVTTSEFFILFYYSPVQLPEYPTIDAKIEEYNNSGLFYNDRIPNFQNFFFRISQFIFNKHNS